MLLIGLLTNRPRNMRILAISGSLRAASSNSALIDAAALLAPRDVDFVVYGGLAGLPHFNPDVDNGEPPPPVKEFREQLTWCDAVLISSPEYAHGVPGALKNALDWLVGSGELIDKPVALINVSPSATHAHASLVETISVMSGRVVEEASIRIPLGGRKPCAEEIAVDPNLAEPLLAAIAALRDSCRAPTR
jgi:chromate reductase, NAD(P)H dehydrogenase (quinone)